jgi:ABC-2 type transport system ATP-binding protein
MRRFLLSKRENAAVIGSTFFGDEKLLKSANRFRQGAQVLEAKGLTKRYREIPVVRNVHFAVRPGEVTGYLGPNGSGKSTTVKMLTGLIAPDAGRVLLDGRDIRDDLIGYKRKIGYVPEEAYVYQYLSALEYLELMGRLRSMSEGLIHRRAGDLLQLFSLHADRHSSLASFSKGMRQRVLIASALLHDPEILIFDEPLSGLDVSSALLFRSLVAELGRAGKTILYISHVLEAVEKVCAKVIVIYKGEIRADESIENLRAMMSLPSSEEIFGQLVPQDNVAATAEDIVAAIKAPA